MVSFEILREIGVDVEKYDRYRGCGMPSHLKEAWDENNLLELEYFYRVRAGEYSRVEEIYKAKKEGSVVVGSFCLFVPEELVLAADGIPIGLCGGSSSSFPEAEPILPREVCPLIKSYVGYKLGGICPYFELSDLVVGETTCDGKTKSFEVLNDLTDEEIMVLHRPNTRDQRSREIWRDEIHRLKNEIEEISKEKISKQNLFRGWQKLDMKKKRLQEVMELRKQLNPPITGLESLMISQLANNQDPQKYAEKLENLQNALIERETPYKDKGPRLLITGSPLVYPNQKILRIAEEVGGRVVHEEMCTGSRYYENQPKLNENQTLNKMIEVLADNYLDIPCACFTGDTDRTDQLLQKIQEFDVDGVIHHSLRSCDPYSLEAYQIKNKLKDKGIPTLVIESDYSKEDIGQLKTRLQAFIEMTK